MGKKGKKGGKGKKGKKDKKGKKGKKNEQKEESIAKMAERNSHIWEARLKMAEFQKQHYVGITKQLAEENTSIIDHMRQNEKDTIEVCAYLRRMNEEKDNEIASLQHELKNIKKTHDTEKEMIIQEFNERINELQETLDKKTMHNEMMQNELDQLKEFRKKKIQMQRELEDIKEALELNEKEHKDHMMRIEEKFFEEKMRLQAEANKKIEELAEKAHDAAIQNLDEMTKNVYKENAQLAESFKLTNAEIERLKKVNKSLQSQYDRVKAENDENSSLVKERVDLIARQGKQLKEQQNKVEILEKSLAQVVSEFESERDNILRKCRIELESSSSELDKLRKTLELKNKEMNRVKKLAKSILEQRGDIERFFLDSLEFVKRQIYYNRAEYRKEANEFYNKKMLAAHLGQADYPKIRTFSRNPNSTNNVFKDLEQAEKWLDINKLVDLNDLTWEQREQVLRELFARMNGTKSSNSDTMALAKLDNNLETDSNDDPSSTRFLEKRDVLNITSTSKYKQNTKSPSKDVTFITQSDANVDDIFAIRSSGERNHENASNKSPTSLPKLPSILTQ